MAERFRDPPDVLERLARTGYLADDSIASVVFLADRLEKPVLVEGPAGVGKTELAKTLAAITNSRLLRLQCYEGLDESRALYEWNYRKQLMRIQAGGGAPDAAGDWKDVEADIFSEPFLLERPLLAAIRATDDVVLLIDEVDRVEVETEALLLEVLAEFQVTIPELGTVVGTRRPLVVLTSNNTRELSEALRRRCLYLALDYPSLDREREILLARIPGIEDRLARQVARVVRAARRLDLRKTPSIGESIDWARALMALGHVDITQEALAETLPVLIKSRPDLVTARRELSVGEQPAPRHLAGGGQNGRVPSEKFSVDRGTAMLAAERWPGNGQPVVLLHAGVADRRSWRGVAEALQPRTSVVAYDMRGYGETTAVTYGFTHLDDLRAVLDRVATGPVWLVGSSMGGELAIDAALSDPDRVAGLVLLAPSVSGAPEPMEVDRDTERLVQLWEAAQTSGDIDEINRIEMWLWLDGPSAPEGRVSGPARTLALEMNAVALKNEMPEESGKSGLAAWSRLEEITVPVTVACGDLDLPFVVSRSKELSDWLPESQHHVLPGVAHLPYLENPAMIAELISSSLR